MGTDGISTTKFQEIIDDEIEIIKRKVKNKTYKFSPYKEQLIVKGKNSLPRMISIPTNRDRLVLSALQQYLLETMQDVLNDETATIKIKTAIKVIQSKEYDGFIKVDIQNFYPNLDHKLLMEKINHYIEDENALSLIQKAICQVTIPQGRRTNKQNSIETKGVPQGLAISNILASIYLHDLDEKYCNMEHLVYFRYVDDILILCKQEDIEQIKKSIVTDIENYQLETHEFQQNSEKSSSGNINRDRFQFLGYEFYKEKISVRESSMDKLYERIIEVFYNTKEKSDKELYRELNLKISGCVYDNKLYGWVAYFRQLNDISLLYALDAFVKNQFKRFKREYDENKIKKFTKAYYFLKKYDVNNLDEKTYLPKFEKKTSKKIKKSILKLVEDVKVY